jgi:Flp pilus assembly protein CpaB
MRKLNISIVVGVIVAVLGAGIVVAYGQSVDKRIANGKHPVSVLVADGDIDAGTPASDVAGRVHVERVPSSYVADGALSSVSALTSDLPRGSVLTGPVPGGGQLTSSDFADAATAGHVRPAAGHVAVAVETDLSPGVARYLSVGSMVDVFATYHDVRNRKGKLTAASGRTKLFASGIKVLAVSVARDTAEEGRTTNSSVLMDKVVALLDMTPADAEKLVNATTLGDIYLADTATDGHRTPTGAVPTDVVGSNR